MLLLDIKSNDKKQKEVMTEKQFKIDSKRFRMVKRARI